MREHEHTEQDQFVETALRVLRDAPVPEPRPALVSTVIDAAGDITDSDGQFTSSVDRQPTRANSPWRHLTLIPAGVAAVILIGVILLWPGSVATPVWAQIVEAVGSKPWIHAVLVKPEGSSSEFWLSTAKGVFASRSETSFSFEDRADRVYFSYNIEEAVLYRTMIENGWNSTEMYGPIFEFVLTGQVRSKATVEWMQLTPHEKRIVTENRREWIEYPFTHFNRRLVGATGSGTHLKVVCRVDPKTRLPQSLTVEYPPDGRGKIERYEYALDYPTDGPADIYALGVPEAATLRDSVPADAIARLAAGVNSARDQFDDYTALVVTTAASNHWSRPEFNSPLPCIFRSWHSGNRWRIEKVHPLELLKWQTARAGTPPPPENVDPAQWWRQEAEQLSFEPLVIADGTYEYLIEDGAQTMSVPYGDSVLRHTYNVALPEFVGHPLISFPPTSVASLEDKPTRGPADTRLVETRMVSGEAQREQQDERRIPSSLLRYWIDPEREHLVMRYELISKGAPGDFVQSHVIEKLAQSPTGHWYPEVLRSEGRLQHEATGTKEDAIYRYYLSFDELIPNHLFKP